MARLNLTMPMEWVTLHEQVGIFDVQLRMATQEFQCMFPMDGGVCEIIEDVDARNIWYAEFGASGHVSFARFFTMVQWRWSELRDAKQFFQMWLRDYVTPYQWNVILNNFGPSSKWADTIRAFKDAFVGYMDLTAVTAVFERAWQEDNKCNHYLLRISRTYPELITVSYSLAGSTRIMHRRKCKQRSLHYLLIAMARGNTSVWRAVRTNVYPFLWN